MVVPCSTPEERKREALADLMDNRRVDVQSAGYRHLSLALELLMDRRPVVHYVLDGCDLVLLTAPMPGSVPLVAPLSTVKQLADFVDSWLLNLAEPQGQLVDHDVQNEPIAFRVWCNEWGRDEKYSFGIGRVQARFAWLGH